jgi:hypothetical protein
LPTNGIDVYLFDPHSLNQHLKASVVDRCPLDGKAQLAHFLKQLLQCLIVIDLRRIGRLHGLPKCSRRKDIAESNEAECTSQDQGFR